jgi:hypothetical protein
MLVLIFHQAWHDKEAISFEAQILLFLCSLPKSPSTAACSVPRDKHSEAPVSSIFIKRRLVLRPRSWHRSLSVNTTSTLCKQAALADRNLLTWSPVEIPLPVSASSWAGSRFINPPSIGTARACTFTRNRTHRRPCQKKAMVFGYGTDRGNAGGHGGALFILVKGMYRAMKQSSKRDMVILRTRGGVVDIPDHLIIVKCHRCEKRFESANKRR